MAIPTVRAFQDIPAERIAWLNYNGTLALNNLDMLVQDPATGNITPASSVNTTNYSTLTSKALLQRWAKRYFVGLSGAQKLATDVADSGFTASSVIADMVCASATWVVGDLVAIDSNGGGTALLSDTVIKTTDPAMAVGVCVKPGTSVTTVRCRMVPTMWAQRMTSHIPGWGRITEAFTFSNLTGGATTTGTYTFTNKLPPGALVFGTQIYVTTVLAGPSLSVATAKVGYSGQLDAFTSNTSTDCFTAAVNVGLNAKEATAGVTSELAPLATFSLTGCNVNALTGGALTISVIYFAPVLSPTAVS